MITPRIAWLLVLVPLLAGCGGPHGGWPAATLDEKAMVLLEHAEPAGTPAVESILREAFPEARRLRAEQLVTAGPGLRQAGAVLVVPEVRRLTPALWTQLLNHLQRGGLALFWGRDPPTSPGGDGCEIFSAASEWYAFSAREIRGMPNGLLTAARPISLQSPFPRPTGPPGATGATERWIPIAEAANPGGATRGWPASIFVRQPSNAPPCAWGWIGWDAASEHGGTITALLRLTAERLQQRQFLLQAGLDRYVMEPGGAFDLRVVVANGNPAASAWRVTAELENEDGVVTRRQAETLAASAPATLVSTSIFLGTAPRQRDAGMKARLRIGLWDAAGTRRLDEVVQPVRLLPEPSPRATPGDERIGVRGNSFIIGRRPVALVGAAYAPAAADRTRSPFDPAQFDPARMRRELGLFRDAGFNALTLSCTHPSEVPQIRYLMDELRDRHLWAILELPALSPWTPDWARARELLAALRLSPGDRYAALSPGPVHPPRAGSEEDTVAAAWRAWLLEQYGQLAHATEVLGADPLAHPPGVWWTDARAEIPRTVRLAALRFLEDWIGRHYGACARFLREQGWPGLFTARSGLTIDPAAGAHHLDFLTLDGADLADNEPGRIEFHTAYARAVGYGKPVLWINIRADMPYPPAEADQRRQAATLDAVSRSLLVSQAAGLVYGGFAGGPQRPGGRDDGLLNPDATWRPGGDALRARAQEWRRPSGAPPPWRGRELDAAGQTDGLRGAWLDWRERYADEAKAGRVEELRPTGWAKSSREWPAEGLGGEPHRDPAPLRQVNAEWIPPAMTTSGVARMGLRQAVRLELINTGLATWAPSVTGHTGAVWIHARSPKGRVQPLGVRETPPGARQSIMWTPTDPGEWVLRPWLHPAGGFGEPLSLHVGP